MDKAPQCLDAFFVYDTSDLVSPANFLGTTVSSSELPIFSNSKYSFAKTLEACNKPGISKGDSKRFELSIFDCKSETIQGLNLESRETALLRVGVNEGVLYELNFLSIFLQICLALSRVRSNKPPTSSRV